MIFSLFIMIQIFSFTPNLSLEPVKFLFALIFRAILVLDHCTDTKLVIPGNAYPLGPFYGGSCHCNDLFAFSGFPGHPAGCYANSCHWGPWLRFLCVYKYSRKITYCQSLAIDHSISFQIVSFPWWRKTESERETRTRSLKSAPTRWMG